MITGVDVDRVIVVIGVDMDWVVVKIGVDMDCVVVLIGAEVTETVVYLPFCPSTNNNLCVKFGKAVQAEENKSV